MRFLFSDVVKNVSWTAVSTDPVDWDDFLGPSLFCNSVICDLGLLVLVFPSVK